MSINLDVGIPKSIKDEFAVASAAVDVASAAAAMHCESTAEQKQLLLDEVTAAVNRCALFGIDLLDGDAIVKLDVLFTHCLLQEKGVQERRRPLSKAAIEQRTMQTEYNKLIRAGPPEKDKDSYYIKKKNLKKCINNARDDETKAGGALDIHCRDIMCMFDDIVRTLEEEKKAKLASGLRGRDSIGRYKPPTDRHAQVFSTFQLVLVKLTLV